MSINFRILLLCGLMVAFGAACSGGNAAEVLPTTTPRPTDVIPTNTPTPLPPPTVTPFPTGSGPGSSVSSEGGEGGTAGTSNEDGNATPDPAATAGSETATPAPSPTTSSASSGNFPEGVTVGEKLYSADFAQGWPSVNDDTAHIAISGGQYVFSVGPFDARFINTSTINAADTYTEVDVRPSDCPAESGYGLVFRFIDASNYFAATIFCNNTFSVVAIVSGSLVGDAFPDGALPGTRDTSANDHVVGILSVGSRHTLYFDGQVVTSFDGGVHEQGDVGLYAISRGESPITVAFDNLEVWAAR